MPKTYYCPFWKWDEKNTVYCEAGKVSLPDRQSSREFVGMYCACLTNWKSCTLAKALLLYYERKI